MIKFKDASFRYFDGQANVLKNIKLEIKKGEQLAIVGNAGTGKSSFLKVILKSDELYLSHGKMFIQDKEIKNLTKLDIRHFLQQIYFFNSSTNLIFHDTVYQNLKHEILIREPFWKQLLGILTTTQKTAIYDALDDMNLTKSAFLKVGTLTPYVHRKIEIAKLLVSDARFIVADDPTTNIDALYSNEILLKIQRIACRRRATLIWASHDNHLVHSHFKNIYFLKDATLKKDEDLNLLREDE